MAKHDKTPARSFPAQLARAASWLTGIGWRGYQQGARPIERQGLEWFYGEDAEADAGVTVTEGAALGLATVKACATILAESVAVLPCGVVRRLPNGDRERAESHPADALVHEAPNPETTIAAFKEAGQFVLGVRGAAFSFIEHDAAGERVGLWQLDGRATYPTRLRSGELRYVTTDVENPRVRRAGVDAGGGRVVLAPEQVLHVPGLSFDGLTGLSPVGVMRQSLGLALALERFNAAALKNGAWLAYALEHPEKLDDKAYDRLRGWFKGNHAGANSFDPAILEEGMKLHQLALPGEDALFLSSRKFQRRDVCAWYRIPPHMVADLEGGASYASVEHMSLEFVVYTLGIWLRKWEQELTRKLCGPVGPGGRREYYVEFNVDAFLRGATLDRFNAYKTARETGWLSVNEIRRRENLAAIPGGDTYTQPLNMGTVGGDPKPPAAPGGKPPPAKAPRKAGDEAEARPSSEVQALGAFEAMATDAAARVLRKAHDRALRSAGLDRPAAEAWAATFFEELAGDLAGATGGVARAFGGLIGSSPSAAERAARTWASVAAGGLRDAFLEAHAAGTVPALAGEWVDGKPLDLGADVVRVVDLNAPE